MLVRGVELDLAAHRGDADAVAVVADPLDDAGEEVALVLGREVAEADRVEDGDRPRAHREDVAQDAADAGGGALEGLDGRRVVVAFHLEGDREAVAHVDHAGVLTGALEDARARRREPPEEGP